MLIAACVLLVAYFAVAAVVAEWAGIRHAREIGDATTYLDGEDRRARVAELGGYLDEAVRAALIWPVTAVRALGDTHPTPVLLASQRATQAPETEPSRLELRRRFYAAWEVYEDSEPGTTQAYIFARVATEAAEELSRIGHPLDLKVLDQMSESLDTYRPPRLD